MLTIQVRMNGSIVTIFFFFKFVTRKPVNNGLHYIYILPGRDKLFGRVVYVVNRNKSRSMFLSREKCAHVILSLHAT